MDSTGPLANKKPRHQGIGFRLDILLVFCYWYCEKGHVLPELQSTTAASVE